MKRSESELGYMYSSSGMSERVNIALTVKALTWLMLAVLWPVAGNAGDTGLAAASTEQGEGCRQVDIDFRAAWAELKLAEDDEPYLILDTGRRELDLRLKGILLWSCPVTYETPDSEAVREMEPYLAGERNPPVEILTSKHLYTYRERFADSVLAVVARVTRVKPEHLQRYEPGHFELRFGRRLLIDVQTGAEAGPGPLLGNALAAMRGTLLAPMTKAKIRLRMESDDALTLYNAAHPRLPILIHATTE